jgi:DNA (cytosine-5)-methyltransferase 1
VRKPWEVLNASNYGVPQSRERLILIGAKKGLTLPMYPTGSTRPAGSGKDLLFPEGPSCKQALDDLPDAELFAELENADSVNVKPSSKLSEYASELRCTTGEAWHYGYRRNWDPMMLTSSMRTEHSEISRRRFAATGQGDVEPISRFFRLPANGVANTLRAGTDAARGAFTSPRPIHYKYARCVTVREMARLHGFPDWFRFHETKWHGARQIGNAVAPPLARAIGSEIFKAMKVLPAKPAAAIDLGALSLIMMDMRQASAYWSVDVPIGKRDRKSGARKRKQWQIEAELSGTFAYAAAPLDEPTD